MSTSPVVGSHHHTQSIAATSWVITHNLNTSAPVVDVWIGGEKVLPLSVDATSALVCTITFNAAQSGSAVVT